MYVDACLYVYIPLCSYGTHVYIMCQCVFVGVSWPIGRALAYRPMDCEFESRPCQLGNEIAV